MSTIIKKLRKVNDRNVLHNGFYYNKVNMFTQPSKFEPPTIVKLNSLNIPKIFKLTYTAIPAKFQKIY